MRIERDDILPEPGVTPGFNRKTHKMRIERSLRCGCGSRGLGRFNRKTHKMRIERIPLGKFIEMEVMFQ